MSTQLKSGKSAITGKTKISRKKSSSALNNAVKHKAKKVAASSLHDDEGDDDELTIEILQKAATEAFTEAAARTMEVMGYNVIAQDGWVVKIFPDGSIEKILKLDSHYTNKPVFLD